MIQRFNRVTARRMYDEYPKHPSPKTEAVVTVLWFLVAALLVATSAPAR